MGSLSYKSPDQPADQLPTVELVPLEDWLDHLMARRARCIAELRELERVLIRNGRIKSPAVAPVRKR